LAQLGYEKLDDIIGRTELLRPRDISLVKTQHLDLSYILSVCVAYNHMFCISFFLPLKQVPASLTSMFYNYHFQNVGVPKLSSTEIRNQEPHTNGPVLDDVLLADPEVTL
jgi:glutamate synthase (ferredoxin)